MGRSDWATLIAVAATIISFGLLMPQIVRLWRTGRTAGVSPTWAATGASSNLGWLAYMVSQGLWVVIPSVVVASVQFLTTFWLLRRNHAKVGLGAMAGMASAVAYATVGMAFGWATLGAVLALSYAIQYTPSVVTAWRTWAPVGISPMTWAIGTVDAAAWGGYGILVEDRNIVLFGIVSGMASTMVLTRLWITRGRQPDTAASAIR